MNCLQILMPVDAIPYQSSSSVFDWHNHIGFQTFPQIRSHLILDPICVMKDNVDNIRSGFAGKYFVQPFPTSLI